MFPSETMNAEKLFLMDSYTSNIRSVIHTDFQSITDNTL